MKLNETQWRRLLEVLKQQFHILEGLEDANLLDLSINVDDRIDFKAWMVPSSDKDIAEYLSTHPVVSPVQRVMIHRPFDAKGSLTVGTNYRTIKGSELMGMTVRMGLINEWLPEIESLATEGAIPEEIAKTEGGFGNE